MNQEINIVDGDLPALISAASQLAVDLRSVDALPPLSDAAHGLPHTHGASMCQTAAGLMSNRWKDFIADLEDFAEALSESHDSFAEHDQLVRSSLEEAIRTENIQHDSGSDDLAWIAQRLG